VTDASYATDGSGLSYDDRETARGEATLLGYAHQSAAAAGLLHALPLGCRRGTLKDRFCHTIGAGTVYAKTGTLTRTSALAGYTTDAEGRWVTFSVICGKVRSVTAAMHAIDRAVLVLRRYSS
jgi:D-alanyl-D-alanine carboxypeptidase/D-alanyl-D-alanine-endopeptidase (penicillin-binding protein 4)